jgi:hypothetical protein
VSAFKAPSYVDVSPCSRSRSCSCSCSCSPPPPSLPPVPRRYSDPARRAECAADALKYSGWMRLGSACACLETALELAAHFSEVRTPFLCLAAGKDTVVDVAGPAKVGTGRRSGTANFKRTHGQCVRCSGSSGHGLRTCELHATHTPVSVAALRPPPFLGHPPLLPPCFCLLPSSRSSRLR